LDTPTNSRLVVRVRDEFHNCWSGNCTTDGNELLTEITNLANTITPDTVNTDLVVSKALFMGDGIIASGGSRHEANQIALYEFKHLGDDYTAYDTSGIEPALNLELIGNVTWLNNYGIQIVSGMAKGTTQDSKKLHDMIKNTGEYSIEAWVIPANVTQEGPARIISYSASTTARNFTLGQTLYNYNYLHRSNTTDENGEPDLSTADADEVLQATLQHVIITFDPVNGRRIYVNGEFTGDADTTAAGNLNDWDDSFALILGNEASSDRQWQGTLRMVAIHNRSLSAAQITQNYEVGVGKNLYMLFAVSDLVNIPQSYIMFEMSLQDNYSYLFNKPTFVSLSDNPDPQNITLKGIRLGINGKEATVGQGYMKLDTTINANNQVLSNIGTIIALEKGADNDEFFLTFDDINGNLNAMSRTVTYTATPVADPDASSDISVRTFDEINASMYEVTGVDPQTTSVLTTYNTVKQQLPAAENIGGFVSANQVAITQLAFAYCSALVDDTSLRTSYFSGFDFTADVATAFSTANTTQKDLTIDALTTSLYNQMITTGLTTAPGYASIRAELSSTIDADGNGVGDGLFEQLTQSCPTNCQSDRTQTIVKGMCAAVLGSAAMLIQ
ncbi:MAG: LamG domain-containing protein, partial [Gammaproteobacteria bacterium]|nr:LamG domain-containing protein [Gammaproteobacteria bacterium]